MYYASEERDHERDYLGNGKDLDDIIARPPLNHDIDLFLSLLVKGCSFRYAAAQAGVSSQTALSWMAIDGLKEQFLIMEAETAEDVDHQLARASGIAIDTLVHIMLQEQNTTGVAHDTNVTIKACQLLLERYDRGLERQNAELRTRVKKLEKQKPVIPALRIVG